MVLKLNGIVLVPKSLCVEGGAVGQKLDSNLGWLLGFRQPSNTLYPDEKIEAESTLDLVGPKYFLISLDDFCNNKPNQDLISNTSNKANFSMPSYYNAQTMGDNCTPPTFNLKQQDVELDLSIMIYGKI